MDTIVPKLYRDYGMYVNTSRAFPLSLDGLKPVERRVLLSTYEVARLKFVKSAKIVGDTIAKYHPHGDSSVYSCLVNLVNRGFIHGQGNFGVDDGIDPCPAASFRYTECKMNQLIQKISFELIDYIDWNAKDMDPEPDFLPSMFPLCLLGNSYVTGIGFGYKTYIPTYKIEDLYKRLLYLLKISKTNIIIKPISNCDILSKDEELEKLLTIGKSKIKMKGRYLINKNDYEVTLLSWPEGKSFKSSDVGDDKKKKTRDTSILGKFNQELISGDIEVENLSTTSTKINFSVKKQRNKFDIFKNIITKLDSNLEGNISFEMIVVDNNEVKMMGVDQLLLKSFNSYKQIYEKMINQKIDELENQKQEYILLLKIRPLLIKYLKDLNNKKISIDDIYKIISDEIDYEENIIKIILSKYRINKLISLDLDINEIDKKIEEFKYILNNLLQHILNKYKEIVEEGKDFL